MKFLISFGALAFVTFSFSTATASDQQYVFPNSLKIPLIGPSQPASNCMTETSIIELQNTLNAKVEIDCVRMSVKAVEQYDDTNDVFLLLAYVNVLHDRGWQTTDMVSGTPLLKSSTNDEGCAEHLMLTGGFLEDYFPDKGFSEDKGQYVFLNFSMNEEGEICGESKLEMSEKK